MQKDKRSFPLPFYLEIKFLYPTSIQETTIPRCRRKHTINSFLSGIFKKSNKIPLKVVVGFFLIDCFLLVQTGVRKKLTVCRPFKLIKEI